MEKRVLISFDKFKHSLSAREACEAAEEAIRQKAPDWETRLCPLSDGGEGFASILTKAAGGSWREKWVTGPRGKPVMAGYGLIDHERIPPPALQLLRLPHPGRVAVMEMASASGLSLLAEDERDPWRASSLGTGELMRHVAQEDQPVAMLLGVGGSATHDLGLGALHALGIRPDVADSAVSPPDRGNPGSFHPRLWEKWEGLRGSPPESFPPVRIACDVENPLLGPRGAAAVFAPQKGLRPEDFQALEMATARMAEMMLRCFRRPESDLDAPGGGAAGGIAFGLGTALGAILVPGYPLLRAWLDLREKMGKTGLVITGEGKFDASSLEGKAPGRMVLEALEAGKPVWVLAGSIDLPPAHSLWRHPGLTVRTIAPAGTGTEESHRRAAEFLRQTVEDLIVKRR